MIKPVHSQIRRIRHEQRLTQKELSARAGMSQDYLAKIENGTKRPREDTLETLARSLDAELVVVPRSHLAEVLKIIEATPAASDPGVGSTFNDVFIPDPEDDHE